MGPPLSPEFNCFRRSVKFARYFHGKKIGIDVSIHIHKYVRSALTPDKVAGLSDMSLDSLRAKTAMYIVGHCHSFLRRGVYPVCVFDGLKFPLKAVAHVARYNSVGDDITGDMKQQNEPAVPIDGELRQVVIDACRVAGIACCTAPYEADSQLRQLDAAGLIDAVESIDCDMTVRGVRVVLVSYDLSTGDAEIIESLAFTKPDTMDFSKHQMQLIQKSPIRAIVRKTGISGLMSIAVLCGCDYVKIKGVGYQTAIKVLIDITKQWRVLKAGEVDRVPTSSEIADGLLVYASKNTAVSRQLQSCSHDRKSIIRKIDEGYTAYVGQIVIDLETSQFVRYSDSVVTGIDPDQSVMDSNSCLAMPNNNVLVALPVEADVVGHADELRGWQDVLMILRLQN